MKLKLQMLILLTSGTLIWNGCSTASPTSGQTAKENSQMNKTETTPTPADEMVSYSTDLEELKKEFNADKGKVRLVTLLSPT